MALTNINKPTTSIANTSKIDISETWASNPYTWALETRTWEELISLIDNISKVSSSITNAAKP